MLEEEDEEAYDTKSRKTRMLKQENSSLVVVDTRNGVARSVVYSELDKESKENVLTDLLVKSAISHALEKQKKVRIIAVWSLTKVVKVIYCCYIFVL